MPASETSDKMIQQLQVTVPVAGSSGSATGEAVTSRPVSGRLIAVHLDYVSQPATADVTLSTVSAPVQTILTLTDANTDGWFYPRVGVVGPTGAALTYDSSEPVAEPAVVNDYLKVAVAGGNAGSVVATLYIET